MHALIPYFSIPTYEIGPVVLDAWTLLVMTGFVVGLEVARARGIKLGLEIKDIVDGAVVTVGMGFVVGHLMHVLAYNPHLIDEQGWIILVKVWAGLSSTGGFLGAILGSVLFYKVLRKRSWMEHADAIVYGFPFAWFFGRLGCFSVHDHKGKLSDFWLAVDFPSGARHDLGLYEALWTLVIAGTFIALRNRKVRPGFFLGLFATMYAPVRFYLDFLRATDLEGADVRYYGFTPAQWIVCGLFGVGLWATLTLYSSPEEGEE